MNEREWQQAEEELCEEMEKKVRQLRGIAEVLSGESSTDIQKAKAKGMMVVLDNWERLIPQ